MQIRPTGPAPAKIMIVGEAPGEQEVARGEPFVGYSGLELSKMLQEAGIMRSACFLTNVIRIRPPGNDIGAFIAERKKDITPQHGLVRDKMCMPPVWEGIELLKREIELVRPNIIIALGNVAMWALTGKSGITSWRGSTLQTDLDLALDYSPKVLPAYSPSSVMRQWSWRQILVHDLRRAKAQSESRELIRPDYYFITRPDYGTVASVLSQLLSQLTSGPKRLAVDIETRAGHIACIGFAWSRLEALCIPLMCVERADGYWTLEEEASLMHLLYQVLAHPNCEVIGQNFSYDAQYFWRHLHYLPRLKHDTMLAQHVCFSNMQKGLDFLSSMYCQHHEYWKDDGKTWDEKTGEDQLWRYNCQDAVITFEVDTVEQANVDSMRLREVHDFQQKLFWPVLQSMNRGIRIDHAKRASFAMSLLDEISAREHWLHTVFDQPINIKSPKQMQELFYGELGQKPILGRKTGTVTCDDEALGRIADREPLLRPVIKKIQELRSLGVFLSTFVNAPLDIDGRMRCSFNIAGTETYRFSSSKNAFGSGLNLQNIPKGGGDDDLELPNVRALFIPDPGHTFFDIDLSSADLRIVVWESDEPEFKAMLKAGADPYTEIAKEFYHDPTISKKDPRRQTFKSFAHGCLTAGHEVLTESGWVPIESYDESEPLMAWDKSTWKAHFEVPSAFTRDLGVHFVKFSGQSYDCEVTHDHRVPYTTDNTIRVGAASAVPSSARLPMCGYFDGALNVPKVEAQLLAAFQADGSADTYGNVRFHFKRQRKMERMRILLAQYCPDSFTETYDSFYIPHRSAGFAKWGKSAGPYLLTWSAEALDVFLEELVHWDGNCSGTVLCHVTTVNKAHADWIQTVAKLRGYGSQVALQREASDKDNRQTLWRVSLNNRRFFNLSSGEKSAVYEKSPTAVYCPTTSTGFFFVRHKGNIFVTGNTNYMGTAKGLAERLGLSVHEAEKTQKWYFGRFPRIKKWQEDLKDQVFKRRMVENVFGYRQYFFDRIEGTIFNQAAAWIPQSTVACLINRAYVNIFEQHPWCEVLLQVHDSLAGQFPTHLGDWAISKIVEAAEIPLPYDDPLVIPVGVKTSTASWGDCG